MDVLKYLVIIVAAMGLINGAMFTACAWIHMETNVVMHEGRDQLAKLEKTRTRLFLTAYAQGALAVAICLLGPQVWDTVFNAY